MGPNTFKAVEIVGHTHMYTRIQELIVWPCGFLKYAHKLQGGMHLATQDAHLLNYFFNCDAEVTQFRSATGDLPMVQWRNLCMKETIGSHKFSSSVWKLEKSLLRLSKTSTCHTVTCFCFRRIRFSLSVEKTSCQSSFGFEYLLPFKILRRRVF